MAAQKAPASSGSDGIPGTHHPMESQSWHDQMRAKVLEAASESRAQGPDSDLFMIDFNFLPVLLQFALSSGVVGEDHVLLQSVERLLLRGLDMEGLISPECWRALKEFGITQQRLLGRRATHLARGRGQPLETNTTRREFVDSHNSGQFGARSLQQANPPVCARLGPQISDFLNALEAGAALASNVTFTSGEGRALIVGRIVQDGMLIKPGLKTDTLFLRNVGCEDYDVSADEARQISEMDDEELRVFVGAHPLCSEYIEVMFNFGNGKHSGYLGCGAKTSKGGASSVDKLMAPYSENCHICRCCLLAVFEDKEPSWEKAQALCSHYCLNCSKDEATSPLGSSCAKHRRKPRLSTRCDRCIAECCDCATLFPDSEHLDCCGMFSSDFLFELL